MADAGIDTAKSPREQRRLRHQDLSRAQFLDAAEEVFGRKGFHDTTLKEIAELAEFSVGSVYSFFDSKDDLFRQIFLRRGDEFMPRLRAVLDDGDGSVVEQLDELVAFEIRWFREHPHFGRLFLRHTSAVMLAVGQGVDAALAANFEESMQLQGALFRRGQQAGVFRAGDPDVLTRMFSGIISSFQALDPAVVSDDPHPAERFSISELQALVRAAFVLDGPT
jgi:TetR/AcrR family transcriptional regulator